MVACLSLPFKSQLSGRREFVTFGLRVVSVLYRHGRVLERHEEEDGAVSLTVSLSDQAQGQLERLFPGVAIPA